MQFDIFNGDADGIFALHQFRLKFGNRESELVTGVKRDINLLSRIETAENSDIVVFDVSLNSNIDSLKKLLNANNRITYFDHHFAGEVPSSTLLDTYIQTSAKTCTSLIVNTYCQSSSPLWAICGAFGDNLHKMAHSLSDSLDLSEQQVEILRELGELFNYNGYGTTLDDLHFNPAHLFRAISPYSSPFDFHADSTELQTLRDGYSNDLELSENLKEEPLPGKNRVYIFPNTPWARRVTGVFSNQKARERTDAAHAIITENSDSTLRISVRAPLNDKRDADTLCNLFTTGGGRAAAAGINYLPAEQYETFLEKFLAYYP